jgi:hypothetical protein
MGERRNNGVSKIGIRTRRGRDVVMILAMYGRCDDVVDVGFVDGGSGRKRALVGSAGDYYIYLGPRAFLCAPAIFRVL